MSQEQTARAKIGSQPVDLVLSHLS